MKQLHQEPPSALSHYRSYLIHAIPVIVILVVTGYMWYVNNPQIINTFFSETTSSEQPTRQMQSEQTSYSQLSQCIFDRKQETQDKDISYAKGSLIVQFYKTVPQGEGIDVLFNYKDLQIVNELRSINGFVIGIPKGQEFEFMCRLELENKDTVKSVQLNSVEPTN